MKKLILLLFVFCLIAYNAANAQKWGLYTFYSIKNANTAYLIDTLNNIYKTWTFSTDKRTGYSSYLIPGDTLVRTVANNGNVLNGGGIHGCVQKVTWDGTVVWDFVYSSSTYVLHHDICPLPNGNVLMICYEVKTPSEAVQAGCNRNVTLWSEKIIEVKPTGATTGTIVWEWHAWDHLCQNYDQTKDNYVSSIVMNPQLININYGTMTDFLHMNGLDYNAALDQITFSSHFYNEIYVIDHSTTTAQAAGHSGGNSGKGGDILYRWGNPAAYQASGTANFNVVHDAHWVPADNPNYPNYLCGFNNAGGTGNKSAFDIFSPPYNGYNYTYTPGQAMPPSSYSYRYSSSIFSQSEGNSQQLPNGNTLMCLSMANTIIEVNSAGTIIWSKTLTGANTHAYRYSLCYVRGPVVTASASSNNVPPGTQITLYSNATSVTESNPSYTYSWSSVPAGFTSSDQNPVVTPTVTTTYTVTITNTAVGCSKSASVAITLTNGIIEKTMDGSKLVYPNPSGGIITINAETLGSEYEIFVYNSIGSVVRQSRNTNVIDLSDCQNGFYQLKIMDKENNIYNCKLILNK
jgi:hypothetical protein